MRMRKWGLHYLCLLILAVVLAGCGASDNNSAANQAPVDGGSITESSAKMQSESESLSVNTTADAKATSAESEAPSAVDKNQITEEGFTSENTDQANAGFTGSDVVAGLNKKLIYHANLIMEVEDYGKAQTEIRNMVTLAQGYIIQFEENMSEYEQGGTFIMKVPASGFSPFLNNLEKVKNKKLQRSIQGQDVSEEYVDLESRLKAKQLLEAQYIEFMKKATKSSDLVAFANELGSIQENIEKLKGRMRYIDQNVSFSTVELRIYQTEETIVVKDKDEQLPLMERASEALKGSMNAISVMFQWIFVVLAGALPVLIGGGIILAIVLVSRKAIRQRRDQHSQLTRQGNREIAKDQSPPAIVDPKPSSADANTDSGEASEEERK